MSNIIELLDDSHDEVVIIDDKQDNNSWELVWSDINKVFNRMIEQCTEADVSKGLMRIFDKMLIPAYKQLDEQYKKSKSFVKVLHRTLQLLQNDPSQKFTHIRDLYETLKLHKVRKKATLITLETNLGKKVGSVIKRKRNTNGNENLLKRNKLEVIDLDGENCSIKTKEKECDVILLENEMELSERKENNFNTDPVLSHENENSKSTVTKNGISPSKEKKNIEANDSFTDVPYDFLIPKSAEVFIEDCKQKDLQKIIGIEKEIAMYKHRIAHLDEQEVFADNVQSPYIISEGYKAKIVELYKELCRVTGKDSVKRHEVKLKVSEGYPPGPVHRLEKFLNNRIEEGDPPFPDFDDVVKCVITSNKLDNLGWSKAQIMKEAASLFTQCGRALQQRRQKREWRHLMGWAEQERFEDDPAANDPALEAKLQENRRIALKKETEILEKYSAMQSQQSKSSQIGNANALRIYCDDSDSLDSDDEHTDFNTTNILEESKDSEGKTLLVEENCVDDASVVIKKEPVDKVIEDLNSFGENFKTIVEDIEDPHLVIEISDTSSDEE